MIKHRFIISGEDARVFAAIPSEASLLTWKKWLRAPDWKALDRLVEAGVERLVSFVERWDRVSDLYGELAVSEGAIYTMDDFQFTPEAERPALLESQRLTVEDRRDQQNKTKAIADAARSALDHARGYVALIKLEEYFHDVAFSISAYFLSHKKDESLPKEKAIVDKSITSFRKVANYAVQNTTNAKRVEVIEKAAAKSFEIANTLTSIHEILVQLERDETTLRELGQQVASLASSEPTPDVQCPPGLPFASYTIEINQTPGHRDIVHIVEGSAWLEAGTVTDAIKSVVEIVSQMLTERGLAPKADTRIPVREIDPRHAAESRAAEERDVEANGRSTKVRTIKFAVSPPRYLRDAAIIILSSPRRAHWVIGHWRHLHGKNVEGEPLTIRTWVRPHIRGLGEAGSTASRVMAPVK